MRPSPAAPAATSRPRLDLADVVSIGTGRTVPAALDAPKVQANQRLYLPECLAELGWQPGDRTRVWAEHGHAQLTHGLAGRGTARKVGAGHRLTLPPATLEAIGADVGGHVVALVPPGGTHLLVLGASALAEVADLLVLPGHVRALVDELAELGLVATRALGRLAARLTPAELDALSGVSVERLHELGVVGGPPTAGMREVR